MIFHVLLLSTMLLRYASLAESEKDDESQKKYKADIKKQVPENFSFFQLFFFFFLLFFCHSQEHFDFPAAVVRNIPQRFHQSPP